MKYFLLIFLSPLLIWAQKDYSGIMEQYMNAQASVNNFGGTVLVMKENKIVLRKGYGLADMEWNIPNEPDAKFRIGSITKQITAVAILQLVAQNKLSLNDRLNKFYPDFPKADSVTIHMLLNHTSGIASYTDMFDFNKVARLSFTKDSMIGFFKNRAYNFSPGTKYKYNNSGYFLLGTIIEKISGLSYHDYLQQNIFSKVGMNHTGVDDPELILPKRAKGYSKAANKITNTEFIAMDWPFSAGVIYSTVDDLYKWDRALYGNSLLSDELKQKMYSPGLNRYGYGFVIDSFENHLRIFHNGGINGFRTRISRFVKDDICVIILSNNESNADIIDAGLSNILFDIPILIPYLHKAIKLESSALDKFVGKYFAAMNLDFIKKDNKLYRHRDGTPDIELIPESASKFFYADGSDRQIEFELDASGNIIKTWFINNGLKGEMKKLD